MSDCEDFQFCVKLTQHSVGQGGMMSGKLKLDAQDVLHWIYDCGSDQSNELERELKKVADQGDVDCLFISHLDRDHVNGVKRLLSKVRVREVVLPYLDDVDKFIAIAGDAATGVVSDTFVTFLTDIEGWFSARGVESIVYISPDSDDGDDRRFPRPVNDGDKHSNQRVETLSEQSGEDPPKPKPFWTVNQSGGATKTTHSSGVTVHRLDVGASLTTKVNAVIDWILVPYAHRPSKELMDRFIDGLNAALPGWNTTSEYLAKILVNRELLQKLKKCYDLIWSDHNRVSMALYSGPVSKYFGDVYECMDAWTYDFDWNDGYPGAYGWLLTGDMHLDVEIRRRRFISYYQSLLEHVSVFSLPHHGSKHNFSPLILDELPYARWGTASYGEDNSHGHPSEAVELEVIQHGMRFKRVSTDERSVFISKCYIRGSL